MTAPTISRSGPAGEAETRPGDTFVTGMLTDLLDAGLTRTRIARHLGVHASTVSTWVTGERTPRGYATFRLARLHRHLTGQVTR